MRWEVKRLDELVSDFITKGATPTTTGHDWAESGIPFLRSECVSADGFEPNGIRYITPAANTQLARSVVRSGDVLISITGNVGRVVRYPDSMPPGNINQHIARVRIEREDVLPDFIVYQLLTPEQQERFGSIHVGAAYPLLSLKQIRETEVRVPPLPEQQRIVGKLDAAFAALAEAQAHVERNRANARELFESYLNGVFEGKGDGWKEYTLPDIADNLDSRRVPITKGDRKAGQYPYYGASGIVDYVHDYIFDEECLLISEDGANLLMRSTPIAFSVSGKYWVNNHAHILRFREKATQSLVEHYLESIDLDPWITGAAQPKLNQSAMNSIPIWLPVAIEARQALVEKLDDLKSETDALETAYQQKLTELAGLKKAVLGAAFRGEL